MQNFVVEMRNIVKRYGHVQVLHGVHFSLLAGEVHALLGGNGAGKSTLMKILIGLHQPDGGEILLNGQPVDLASIEVARHYGVSMIFQEFSLVPSLTVAQNVFLGREPRDHFGFIDDNGANKLTLQLFQAMGLAVDPRAILGTLDLAFWQLTEIAKALSQNARILIMDEPTATLSRAETDNLIEIIRLLKGKGISIIYISHRIDEVLRISDRITILRDGRNSSTVQAAHTSPGEIIESISGGNVQKRSRPTLSRHFGTPLLQAQELSSGKRIRNVSLNLHPGEVLGLAGLMGSGRTELLQTLFGIIPIIAGKIIVKGKVARLRTPRDAIRLGIALIPEDRHKQGLVLNHSIHSNLLLPLLHHQLFINHKAGNATVNSAMASYSIHPALPEVLTRILSGGNQQKVVIAKWLETAPDILLFDEPMAGIDVGVKEEITQRVFQFARAGKGILLTSSEPAELLDMCERILILKDGRIAAEVHRDEITDERELHQLLQASPAE